MKKLLTFLFILTAFTSSAQVYQRDPSYGRSIDRYQVLKALHIPTTSGVPNLLDDVITNTSALAYDSTGHKFYVYDPSTETWGQVTGGGVVVESGVDSITYRNNTLCQWVGGVSTCYRLSKFYDSSAYKNEKIYFYNGGNLTDSLTIPHDTLNLDKYLSYDSTSKTLSLKISNDPGNTFDSLKAITEYAAKKYAKNYADSAVAAGGGGIDTTSLSGRIDANTTAISGKQDALTLTTTGTSGAATLTGSTLNIPQYSGGGGGSSSGVDSTNTATSAGQTTFTFPYILTDYTVSKQVTRNGVLINPNDYTISGSDITFTGFSCDIDDKIRFIGIK